MAAPVHYNVTAESKMAAPVHYNVRPATVNVRPATVNATVYVVRWRRLSITMFSLHACPVAALLPPAGAGLSLI